MTFVLLLLFSLGFTAGDEGPGICPVGYMHAHSEAADSGPGADPDGAPVHANGGGAMDPNGTNTLGDKGMGVDPNG